MKQWFVVQSKPKLENVAEVNLRRQGYETYCPRVIQNRRSRGQWKKTIEPLFPRYLFVRLELERDDFAPIRSTLGVKGLVCFGGVPRVLRPGIIEEIKTRESDLDGLNIGRPQWQVGEEVEVTDGALSGLKGLFLAQSGEERVVILLNMLGREHEVLVSPDNIVPA